MTQVDVTFILTIFGVLFSLTTIGLLTASQIKQNWISYMFAESGTTNGGFIATTNADIGIWETSYTIVSVFTSPFIPILTLSDTIDSSTTGYFSEDAVKLCRALGILATVSTLATIVLAVGSLIMPKESKLRLSTKPDIVILCTNGFTVFTATLALIVVRTQFKDGMSIDTSFYIAIAADIISAFALAMFITTFIFKRQRSKGASSIVPVNDGKEQTINENTQQKV